MADKVKKSIFKRWWFWVVAVIVIVTAANSGGEDTPTTSSSTSGSSSTTTTNNSPPKELSKEGVSSDVKIVVEGFDSKDTVGTNQFSTAKAQGVFKVVKVTLTNNQKDAITIDSNSFKLVDDQKREFSYSTDGQIAYITSLGQQESFFLKQLNPGLSITGYIVFDVPKDAKGFTLKARGGFTGKEISLKVE